jgi:hypothetical protein
MPTELHKLLGDSDAAAAAAAFLGHDLQASVLGSCEVLSPVRARRQLQHALGATDQVRRVTEVHSLGSSNVRTCTHRLLVDQVPL